jgi:hypothetical protein
MPTAHYLLPAAGARFSVDLILSGTRRQDLLGVLPGACILMIEWTCPDFFVDLNRLKYESCGQMDSSFGARHLRLFVKTILVTISI